MVQKDFKTIFTSSLTLLKPKIVTKWSISLFTRSLDAVPCHNSKILFLFNASEIPEKKKQKQLDV